MLPLVEKNVDGQRIYRAAADMFCPFIELTKQELWELRRQPPAQPLALYNLAQPIPTLPPIGVPLKIVNSIAEPRHWTPAQLSDERKLLRRAEHLDITLRWRLGSQLFPDGNRSLVEFASDHILTCAASRVEATALLDYLTNRKCLIIEGSHSGVYVFRDLSVLVENSCCHDLCGVMCVWNDSYCKLSLGIMACFIAARIAESRGVRYNLGVSGAEYPYKQRIGTGTQAVYGALLGGAAALRLLDQSPSHAAEFTREQIDEISER
jgi:hypothetical protein